MKQLVIPVAKVLGVASRLRGGSGSAVPGLFLEKVAPGLIAKEFKGLDHGTIMVTGTNGKTTTTKLIADALEAQGLRVLTNKTGSNFTRGILSMLVSESSFFGRLHYDIAVLEIDEAYSPRLAADIRPEVLVALNVHRDQLDRYGEIDKTAAMIGQAMTHANMVVVNANDPLLLDQAETYAKDVVTFGVSADLLAELPTDDQIHSGEEQLDDLAEVLEQAAEIEADYQVVRYGNSADGWYYHMMASGVEYEGQLHIEGIHNVVNAVAAVAAVADVTGLERLHYIVDSLASSRPAFGRGEQLQVGETGFLFGLVKNPAGYNHNLSTMLQADVDGLLLACNDDYADGRDVSWYWDVHFENYVDQMIGRQIVITGVRAFDMAVRLRPVVEQNILVIQDPAEALQHMINEGLKKVVVLPTYTAMLELRDELSKLTTVRRMHE